MEEGVAHLCYIKSAITLIKEKIEKSIPKKKSGADVHEKALNIFFKNCFDIMIKIDFEKIKCLIIASPGFVKDYFYKFIREMA